MKKNTILFILSSGHSGSTILDLALGTHKDCFSLGEISEIQTEIDCDTHCVCGDTISTCDFWTRVKATLFKKYHINIKTGGDFCIKPQAKSKQTIINKIKTSLKITGISKIKDSWIINADHIYNAIFQVSNSPILIDSSKNLIRALLINKTLKNYDIKFLHLVRDVRGVAHSYNKKSFSVRLPGEEKKEVQRTKDIFPIADACGMWNRYNGRITLMLKTLVNKKNAKRVMYENLCANPDETLKDIVEWLGLEYTDSLKKFSSAEHHNVGGNTSRFNSAEIKSVDEKWRNLLDKNDINKCMKKARWLNWYYGYRSGKNHPF